MGLLHDVDYELYPDEHCVKCVEILRAEGYSEDVIRSIASHGYNIVVDIEPIHQMEKVLYAVDELSGIIGAAARMRPSGSVSDMELSSLKKKFKNKSFAAGCSRETIAAGAQMLDWDIEKLLTLTLEAMKSIEADVNEECSKILEQSA